MKKRLLWIDVLRIIAIFSVIVMHVIGNTTYTLNVNNTIYNIINVILYSVMPLFVMISGILFLDKDINYKDYHFKKGELINCDGDDSMIRSEDILIGFLQIYNSKKKDIITLTDAMSLMVPYAIAFSILWLLIIIGFYIMGLPLGFNTGVML